MTKNHDNTPNARRVSETAPVQVYLDRSDRARLERLTEQLDATKSDVLRRSLVALEERAIVEWLARFHDQDFSFTDAVSFAVMRSRRIRNALTLDRHFAVAGYSVVGDGDA